MELKKDELLEMLKTRGVDLAEESLEEALKGVGHLVLDVLGKMADESENKYDDMIKAAVEGPLREKVDSIEVKL